MSEKRLLRHIKEEAERRLREIHETAEQEAERIRKAAQSEIEEMRARMRREAAREAEKQKALAIAKAKREARATVRQERSKAVERAMKEVLSRLGSFRATKDYPEVFRLLAAEAAKEMNHAARALVAPGDEELCRTAMKDRGRAWKVETSHDIQGGIVLTTADGRERVVNTLRSRCHRGREGLLRVLAEELFSPGRQQ